MTEVYFYSHLQKIIYGNSIGFSKSSHTIINSRLFLSQVHTFSCSFT